MFRNRWRFHPHVDNNLSRGERAADAAVRVMGSWAFIWSQTAFLSVWVLLNVVAWFQHWDEYPFILLNLGLSTQAAYAAPLVLLAQRRTDKRASELAESDHVINMEAIGLLRKIASDSN